MSLGATVSSSLGEDITHFVCSNGSTARLAASIVLSIKVVGPSWIEKCKKEGKKIDESGHAVISGITASDAAAAVLSISNGCISPARKTSKSGSSRTGRNDSFYSTDSTRKVRKDQKNDTEQQELNRSGARAAVASSGRKNGICFLNLSPSTGNPPLSSSFNDHFPAEGKDNISYVDGYGHCQIQPNSAYKSPYYSISRNSINKSTSNSSSSKDSQFIPLPSYREYSSGVLPTALKMQRRSERICDNVEQVSPSVLPIFLTCMCDFVSSHCAML